MTPNPSNLPDHCLRNIFSRVSIFDLLRSVRVVCTNWHRVVPLELKRRNSVVLVQDFNRDVKMIREYENIFKSELIELVRRDEDGHVPWARFRSADQINFDVIPVPRSFLTEKFATPLMNTLTNITNLTIVQLDLPPLNVFEALKQIIRLLNHYRNNLVSLKLDYSSRKDIISQNRNHFRTSVFKMYDSINQLGGTLRHLRFNFNLPSNLSEPSLTILPRLASFTPRKSPSVASMMAEYGQYADGRDDVRIDCDRQLHLNELMALEPQLAVKFISATVEYTVQYNEMRQFGNRFTSLIHLSLIIPQYFNHAAALPMTMLARCLSPLTQLIHLKLNCDLIPPEEIVPLQPDQFVQVSSVRLISLTFRTESHLDTGRLHLAEIFSNLQVIDINIKQIGIMCVECNVGLEVDRDQVAPLLVNDDNAVNDPVIQCLGLTLQPFQQCVNLHTIKLDGIMANLLANNWIDVEQLGEL